MFQIARGILDGPAPQIPCASAVAEAGNPNEIIGMSAEVERARIPRDKAAALEAELCAQGAIHVQELTAADWKALSSWVALLPFEQRRLLASLEA